MRSSSFLFLWSALYSWTNATVDPKCTKGIQGIIGPLKGYPPATNFCKSKFPAATKTITATPRTISTTVTATTPFTTSTIYTSVVLTVTSIAPAVTTTTTVVEAPSTFNTILTGDPVTTTVTAIVTTQIVTATVTRAAAGKLAAANTADARAAQWSGIVKVAGAVLSTFCSCAVPAPVTTFTPSVTQTITNTPATNTAITTITTTTTTTVVETPTVTSIVTSVPVVTVTAFTTATITAFESVTATSTQTTTVDPVDNSNAPCNGEVDNTCRLVGARLMRVHCNTGYSGTPFDSEGTYAQCLAKCASTNCRSFSYLPGQCFLWSATMNGDPSGNAFALDACTGLVEDASCPVSS